MGCSSPITHNLNQNELPAWNGTFWGMSEQDLKNHLELKLNLKDYSESFCGEEFLKENNFKKENCKFIGIDNYKIANNHYGLTFSLRNNKLDEIRFWRYFMEEREENEDIEDIFVNLAKTNQSVMTATLELKELLTEKYGTPEQVEEDGKFEYLWDLGYTNIKLSSINLVGVFLDYQPDRTQMYLDTLPEDHNKL